VLDEVLERPPAERAALVDALCDEDRLLRAWVDRLLAADCTMNALLDAPERSAATAGADDRDPFRPGQRLGRWRLLRDIGEGGMGAVLLAEHADKGHDQRVAIKCIHRRLLTDELLRRFEREQRILSRLEHPNIARAVDAGTAEDGTPWLAMEFVPGEPITDWCAHHETDLASTLALFEQVAHAVQFAHQHYVIHRDLKPGNILVSEPGTATLLDFGIAKLLEGEGGMESSTTGLEWRLTPLYAAPEQIRGERAAAATDVYSLGVVLYELLTGGNPHGSTDDLIEMVRRVLEVDPVTPSVALARSGAPPRQRAWRSAVRPDLDRIVMKAMRREPAGRYQSVRALLDDLERWRRHERVTATPPTLLFRLRRFLAPRRR
jgi:serine/threonine-protein kinase